MEILRSIGFYRDKVESSFGAWADFVFQHPFKIICLFAVLITVIGSKIPDITFESSPEDFLAQDNPYRATYDKFRQEFGRDEMIILVVDAKGSIFDIDFLEKLKALHQAIEEDTPRLQEVMSLVNARDTQGINNELVVQDLLEDLPKSAQDLQALKQRIQRNPLLTDRLTDKNYTSTLILIKTDAYSNLDKDGHVIGEDPLSALDGFDSEGIDNSEENQRPFITGEENDAIVKALLATVAQFESEDFVIQAGGTPIMVQRLSTILLNDMTVFTGLAILIIAITLALIFRRLEIVFLPLLVALLSLTVTLGIMPLLGISISIANQILPSLLIAIGVGNSVHIFTPFYQAIDRGQNKRQALRHALNHSGLPVVLTSLTTAGGLASFISAEVHPIADFGIIAPIGVICTQIFTLSLLPALISLVPIKQGNAIERKRSISQRLVQQCGHVAANQPYKVVLAWALILAISILCATQVRVSHNQISWFPEDDPFRMASERLNKEYSGNVNVELLLDTGQENGVHEPDFLKQIERFYEAAAGLENGSVRIGKSVSIIDINKELHRALNNNDQDYYTIPQQRSTIAQELLLLENSGNEDVSKLVDSQFSKARVTMTIPFVDAVEYPPFQRALVQTADKIFDDDIDVTFTGLSTIMTHMVVALINSMIKTYVFAFVIITPLMILLIGSIRVGLISMIPNLCPIIITLGLMGLVGIPLDAFTLLIGSIALGLAVDDTIHFMHNYQRYYYWYRDSERAISETLKTTGQALLFTTVVLSGGFFIYAFSSMNNLFNFGVLTAFCIIYAFLADILLAPALVTLLSRYDANSIPAVELPEDRALADTGESAALL